MWQLLLGAAVAGSTSLLAKHLFSPNPNNPFSQQAPICENDQIPGQELQSQPVIQLQDGFTQSGLEINSEDQKKDGIFTFSSAGSSRKQGLSAEKKILRKKSLKKAERRYSGEQVGGRRFSLCLKRRRTVKNVDHKCDSCSSKDYSSGNSVFGWGLGVGIMYMMSAGKTEISRLNSSMDETVKIVQELQNELNRRKPSQTALASNSDNNVSTHCKKVGSSNVQLTLSNSSNGHSFLNNIRGRGIPVSDDGECASSVLTDEPEPEAAAEVPEMDQLEAELESELQKLSGQEIYVQNVMSVDAPVGQSHGNYQCHGVSPAELDQKLCRLLLEQQENQIVELESELHSAQSKLHEKEAELEALKDCVRRLTHFSLAAVSDEETEATAEECMNEPEGHGSESRKPLVGMKRPINS